MTEARDEVICSDAFYIEYNEGNVMNELVRATGKVMPLVMLGETPLEVTFEACIEDSFLEHDGFLLNVSLTGENC